MLRFQLIRINPIGGAFQGFYFGKPSRFQLIRINPIGGDLENGTELEKVRFGFQLIRINPIGGVISDTRWKFSIHVSN